MFQTVFQTVHTSPPFGNSETNVNDAEFIVLGVPIDQRSTGRKATVSGPDCIRRASLDLEVMSLRFKVNYDKLRMSDIGNISTLNFERALRDVYDIVSQIKKRGKKPIVLGGEHTFTFPTVRALKPTHLVVFDAHLDLRNEYLGETLSHTTYLRRISEDREDLKVICLGYRGFCQEEIDYAKRRKILAFSSYELMDDPTKVAKVVSDELSSGKIYVSVDVDVLDPAFMSDVGNPEPEGIFPRDLMDLFKLFIDMDVIGFDVMELSPTTNWSPCHYLAAKMVYELMAVIAKQKI